MTRHRRRRHPRPNDYRPQSKVICVGNIHSGGSGKTPLVLELARRLGDRNAAILARGYRGSLSAAGARVDRAAEDGAEKYGDEPWMLSQLVDIPVYIGRERAQLVRRIEADLGTGLIILDDGFQHFALRRDVDLVAINPGQSPSENFALPLGDLRESVKSVGAASAVILHEGPFADDWNRLLCEQFPNVPRFRTRRQSTGLWDERGPVPEIEKRRLGFFCGVANSERFHQDTRSFIDAIFVRAFPDHCRYTEEDIDFLLREKSKNRIEYLVTTDKDRVKLAAPFERHGHKLLVLRTGYELDASFWPWLNDRLGDS